MPSLFKQSKFTPQTSMAKSQWLVVIVILLLASALRFHALAQDARFHPDEALFATFARNAAVKGDWLLRGPLDKTPLTIYAQALSMTFFGVQQVNDVLDLEIHTGEFVARLPNTFASILLVAVMYALAKRFYPFGVYGEGGQTSKRVWEVGLISMTLTAFSPYAVAFSATAFTDGLMLLLITLALWMASAGRWAWSGFYLVLAYASKQQALLYAPLILTVGWAVGALYITPLRKLFHFIMPLALGFSGLFFWDAARAQETGVWALAQLNNDPGRLIRSNEILPRFYAWIDYCGVLLSADWLTALLIITAFLALAWRIACQPRQRATMVDVLLFTYLMGYFLLHWLVAFNLYDRYLLPLLPVVILVCARGTTWIGAILSAENQLRRIPIKNVVTLLLCVLALSFSGWNASEGRVRVGGDLGRHQGVDALAAYLNTKPVATVIYDRWLGWELDYYLGAWHDKRRVYYPTPKALVEDALLLRETAPRYLPAPAGQPITPWLNAVRNAGFAVNKVYDTPQFVVYEIIPRQFGAGA